MAEYPYDNDVAIDPVQRATDARIRREALRQLNTLDIEDDNSRIEPLPGAETNSVEVRADSILDRICLDEACHRGD